MRLSRRALAVLILAAIAGSVGGAVAHHKIWRWKRFDVVESGVLYRSGILKDWQLQRAIERYHLKTVYSLTHTNNDREQRVCDAAGVRRHLVYLHGNGQGPDDAYLRFLQLIQDPANHPMLVHCSAGVQRTGGAVLLYRVLFQDWPFERAVEEMIAKGNRGRPAQIEQLRAVVAKLSGNPAVTATARRDHWLQ